MITLGELQILAERAVAIPGESLTPLERSLIELAVAVSVTSLNRAAIDQAIADAFDAGASPVQVQEILSLVSGLGVHSLMVASATVVEQARARGLALSATFSPDQQLLWDTHVGADPFWTVFERELPGFLRSMLLLSSDQFAAFFAYCAVPWKSGQVRAKVKELAAMACDATPAHRFLPGFRLHLANAVALGVGSLAVQEAMAIAASAPEHTGTA